MIPTELKDLLRPRIGPIPLCFRLIPGGPAAVPQEGWRPGGQNPGRLSRSVYWVLSTPIAAVALVHLALTGCAAGLVGGRRGRRDRHRRARRRNGSASVARRLPTALPTREGSLRVLEAARLHRLLGGAPIIVTGGVGSSPYSESALMAHQLEQLGVPADEIIKEEKSTNTRDHALFVPPLLRAARHRAVRAGDVAAAHRPRAAASSAKWASIRCRRRPRCTSDTVTFSRSICRRRRAYPPASR